MFRCKWPNRGVDLANPDLELLADTTCTFTNELKVAQLEVAKTVATVDPVVDALASAADLWPLEIVDYYATATGTPTTKVYVPAGSAISFAEGAGATGGSNPDDISYVTSWSCTDAAATSGGGQTGSVTLSEGEDVTCTFVNTPETTTLSLLKTVNDDFNITGVSIPAGDWDLNIAIDGGAATSYATGDTITLPKYTTGGVPVVATEGYSGTDGDPTQYLSTVQCASEAVTAETTYDALTQSFTAGLADVSCTYVNTLNLAQVDMAKIFSDLGLTPATAENFTLEFLQNGAVVNAIAPTTGALSGTDGVLWASTYYVRPGAGFSVNETADATSSPYQWDSSLSCTGSSITPTSEVIEIGTATAIGDIAVGAEVSCTYTNTLQSASLTLIKSVTGETVDGFTAPLPEHWNLIYGANGEFLASGASILLPKGTYNLDEAYNAGDGKDAFYEWTTLDCGGATDAEGNPISLTNLDLDLQADTTCTFTNELQTVDLTLEKEVTDLGIATVDDLTSPATDWALQFTGSALSGVDLSGTGSITQTVLADTSYDLFEGAATAAGVNPDTVSYTTTWSCTDGTSGSGQTGAVTLTDTDVTCTFVNTPETTTLSLLKTVNDDFNITGVSIPAGDWDLNIAIDGGAATSYATGDTITLPKYTTGGVPVVATEGYSGTTGDPSQYLSTIQCASEAVTAETTYDAVTQTFTAGLADISCTYVNTLNLAKVDMAKIFDDLDLTDFDKDDFTLEFLQGGSVVQAISPNMFPTSGTDGGAWSGSYYVTPGTGFSVNEIAHSGAENYQWDSTLTCTGSSISPTGEVIEIGTATPIGDIAVGAEVSCTYQNTLQSAELTLVKSVTGATVTGFTPPDPEDWDLIYGAGGEFLLSGAANNPIRLPKGTYNLDEDYNAGDGKDAFYEWTTLDCGGATDAEGNPITIDNLDLDLQADTTCEFTNELQTVDLTLNKTVTDLGIATVDDLTSPATDWALQFTGSALSGVDLSGTGEITQTVLANTSYDLFEGEATTAGSNPDTVSYTTTWSCTDGTSGTSQTGAVTLTDTDVTCTFVNTPETIKLTLSKDLRNNGLDNPVPAGLEGIVTDALTDWELTADITLGTATSSQTGTDGVEITLPQVSDGLSVEVSEAVVAGEGSEAAYKSYVYCGNPPDPAPAGGLPSEATTTITPTNADESCTFVNEIVSADVVLTKYVDNGDLDGTALNLAGSGDFDLTFTGPNGGTYTDTVTTGTTVTLPVGSYDFTDAVTAAYSGEADALEYEYSGVICSADVVSEADVLASTALSASSAISEDTAYCYYVNRVTAAQIAVVKDVQNDSGGAAVIEDFTLYVDEGLGSEQIVTSGVAVPVSAGAHTVSETWEVLGYTQDSLTCMDDATEASIAVAAGALTLAAGQAVTCTFVNVDGVPGIELTKASTVTEISEPVAGTVIPYTFEFTNTGELPLTSVVLTDTNIDAAEITCQRADGTGFDHVAGDNLAIDETITCSAEYTLTQDDIDGISDNVAVIDGVLNLVNSAEVVGSTPDGEEVNDVDDTSVVNIPIVQTAAMAVTKTADVEAGLVLGDVVTYTIEVTNTGNTTLSNVTTNDFLLTGSGDLTLALTGETLTTGTLSSDGTADDGVWDSLAPAETVSFTATYEITQVDIDVGDDIINTVEVTALTSQGAVLEGVADVIVAVERVVDISIVKSADKLNELVEGDVVTYSFLVTNEGTVTLSGIQVVDSHVTINGEELLALDAGILQTDNGAQGDSKKGNASNGGWDILAPGDQILFTATYTITADDQIAVNDDVKSTITNKARVTGKDNGQEITVDDNDSVTIELEKVVSPAGDYTLVKTADRTEAERGGVVSYTITVTETSGVGGTETVKDVLPAGFTYIDGSATGNFSSVRVSEDGRTTTFVDLVIPSGSQPTSIRLQARVSPSVEPGIYTNTASMTYESANGGLTTISDTAKVRINVEAVFDCGDVIGKVYEDRNQDGYQNQGEPGIPNAKLVTADGKIIRADAYGRYHVPCALLPKKIGSNFSLKLDTRSLPTGYRVMTENPRVVRLTRGKMTELNFGVAISQVVRIDLTNAAFDAQGNPRAKLVEGVRSVARSIAKDPSMVRISYYVGSGTDRATNAVYSERMNLVERILRDEWARVGRYKLNVEKTILRKR